MSLSSTSPAPARGSGRVVTAVAVAVAVLVPLAVLFVQVWSSSGGVRSFTADERHGVAYLAPLTRLLSATTEAQSAAVRNQPVDTAAVRAAVAGVDEADARLGRALETTDRWTDARQLVQQRLSVPNWQASAAYTQYSDVNTKLLDLTRTVGDNSRLVLDPEIDAYYVMNASLLRIPEILVDSGRYTDLSVLFPNGSGNAAITAQLAAARNRIAADETDLSAGLLKAFARTDSGTLGPGLTRPLDDFRSAVDAVAPSASLLAPAPERSTSDLIANQDALQQATLSLQEASLDQLDGLLADRAGEQVRSQVIAAVAAVVGIVVAVWLARLAWRWAPLRPRRRGRYLDDDDLDDDPDDALDDEPDGTPYRSTNGTPVPVRTERSGGARAAR